MKFGIILPNNWGIADPVAVADMAVEAEDLGLDSVWVNHHIVNAGYIADRLGNTPYHDALTVLTWAAARTERVKLGTSVLVMPYLHPMVAAKALATLDLMSGGRVVPGLGVGSLPEENEMLGVLYEARGSFGDEFIEVMQALWTEDNASYHGNHFHFVDVITSPKPAQSTMPVWIGGAGAPARRRAAKYGTGWHPMVSVEGLERRMPAMLQALEANDRERESLTIAPRVDVTSLPDAASIDAWRQAGADELIVGISSRNLADHRAGLAHVAELANAVV
ncbi:MAG: TIGR03619 family F420-dependent LLM class oxidoreductase [Acidimicrobiaceae bacterium]|jgi:probable F420-dependent oxidoreductase|nr:TIGR03619 family F420-dependent LLM class oxidoreductase [Acidimicrobiaceae bacterium]MCO4833129.1 TIGR03619 family F420-dependent LLM class oxidoreductase [Acidimicrobiaceae bacterium]MDA9241563.1 TIGR03619 family F420-dependent LLM class oxidoreductase [bacterium]MDG1088051.1 TIGR03619 family F420-dependent LLM class oxidoreductase [Acidimicrobiales bacterium]